MGWEVLSMVVSYISVDFLPIVKEKINSTLLNWHN